jgi:hypothetical protein
LPYGHHHLAIVVLNAARLLQNRAERSVRAMALAAQVDGRSRWRSQRVAALKCSGDIVLIEAGDKILRTLASSSANLYTDEAP